MHPFMPFVTEELWQRLPRRANDTNPTIVKARYPQFVAEFDNSAAERDYDLVFSAIKTVRSLASEYNIKDKMEVFIHAKDSETYETFAGQTDSIKALVKGAEKISTVKEGSQVPDGCAAGVLGEQAVVYLLVKGRVNVDEEVAKTQKKAAKVAEARKRLEASRAKKDYQTKVKPEVQAQDEKKLKEYLEEEKTLEDLVKKFEGLRA